MTIEIRDGDNAEKHLKSSGAGTSGDPFIPEHTVGGTVTADVTGQGDVPVTLDGETVVLGAGTATFGKLAANPGTDIGDVDVASLPVGNAGMAASTPVTIASDDTLITALKTALEIIDNAVAGSEMQVDVVAALPAGTNAIGKLAANSGTDIGDVDVTSIAAGETHLGEVGAATAVKEITFSLDTGGAYADGDVLAATQEIATAMRVNAGTGIIQSVIILDKDDQGENLDVVFLKTNVSLGTENAVVSITDGDADEIQGVVEVSSYVDLTNSQIATKTNLGIGVQADSGATSLFIGLISRGTGTYTASGVTAKITILQD